MNISQLFITMFVLQLIINIATAYVMIRNLQQYSKNVDVSVQQAITDVASQIGENFVQVFEKPNVSRAMSVLGKKSGVVRAEKATLDKFSEKLPDLIPSLGIIGEQLGMEPLEMLQLFNDPLIGPVIQRFIGGIHKPGPGDKKTSMGAIS